VHSRSQRQFTAHWGALLLRIQRVDAMGELTVLMLANVLERQPTAAFESLAFEPAETDRAPPANGTVVFAWQASQ
jgi:hypothetical protein